MLGARCGTQSMDPGITRDHALSQRQMLIHWATQASLKQFLEMYNWYAKKGKKIESYKMFIKTIEGKKKNHRIHNIYLQLIQIYFQTKLYCYSWAVWVPYNNKRFLIFPSSLILLLSLTSFICKQTWHICNYDTYIPKHCCYYFE